MVRIFLVLLAAVLTTGPVQAQSEPLTQQLTLTFTGKVTDDLRSTLEVFNPTTGEFTKWEGPVPDYPYQIGDDVTLSVETTVPTKAGYAAGIPGVAIDADGLSRTALYGPNNGTTELGIGLSSIDVSGPIIATTTAGQPLGFGGMSLVYDSATDNYSLEFPRGNWNAGRFDVTGVAYNPDTQTVSTTPRSCRGADCSEGGLALSGAENNIVARNILVSGAEGSSLAGGFLGVFTLGFSGSWSLPFFGSGSGGSPVDVPAPPMALLYAVASGLLLWTRRRQLRPAT